MPRIVASPPTPPVVEHDASDGYSVIPNSVRRDIRQAASDVGVSSSDALALYIEATSTAPDWTLRQAWLRDRLGWGVVRLRRATEVLAAAGLWSTTRVRDLRGRIRTAYTVVRQVVRATAQSGRRVKLKPWAATMTGTTVPVPDSVELVLAAALPPVEQRRPMPAHLRRAGRSARTVVTDAGPVAESHRGLGRGELPTRTGRI